MTWFFRPEPTPLGVGNDPDPVPAVRSANGGSGYTVPLRIIPERSEAPEDDVQSARAKGADVFDDDPRRADFRDEAVELEPEAAAFTGKSCSFSCEADILAGESSTDDIDFLRHIGGGQCGHIFKNRYVGPVLTQHQPSFGVDLAKRGGPHARALQPQREAPDPAEQV
jgi:hypothetical protein